LALTTAQSFVWLEVNGVNDFNILTGAYSTKFKESVVRWMQEDNQSF
jgi:hypothetical protein